MCYFARNAVRFISEKWLPKAFADEMQFSQTFSSAVQLRTFVASGAAAGIASAFNAPICGVLFVQAESKVFWSRKAATRVFLTVMTISMCTSYYRNSFSGDMSQKNVIWNLTSGGWSLNEFFNFLLIGIVGGLLGALVCTINNKVDRARHKLLLGRTELWKVLEACLCSLAFASIYFSLSFTGTCRPIAELLNRSTAEGARQNLGQFAGSVTNNSHPYVVFNCPNGTYNPTATLFLGGPLLSFNLLLDSDGTAFALSTVACYGIAIFVTMSTS